MRELSLNILDIAQNSISAGAKLIRIAVAEEGGALTVTVADNGRGMTAEQLQNVKDPFFTTRTARKVGMGIPLFRLAAEQTGGSLEISSELGRGTEVTAVFKSGSIDMTPVGDMGATMSALIGMNPEIDFIYTRNCEGKEFTLDTREMKEILGEVSLADPLVSGWINDFITENTEAILGGA